MTKSQDYPILHFQQMEQLAKALKKLPAQVEDHKYAYSSFGSWQTTIRCKGKNVKIIFDGKESEYSIHHSLDNEQNEWADSKVLKPFGSTDPIPVEKIVEAVQNNGKLA